MTKLATLLSILIISNMAYAQSPEPFTKTVINTGYQFEHPFDMFLGDEDSLWINERSGAVWQVHKSNGGRKQLLNIKSQVMFTRIFSGPTVTGIAQDGMFGMALHPDAFMGLGKDSFFVAYCYNSSGRKTRISRFYINPITKIINPATEVAILQNLPGSNDHNGGKLIFGGDKMLYYSCGDQGANQFGNACIEIKSQKDITAAQLSAVDYTNYAGHILRLTTGGLIPASNPLFNSVRSHVYSKGHRNPQGLSWEKDNAGNPVVNGKLYESEQGPVTDDEINVIESGKNYGWPHINGFNDNQFYTYKRWFLSGSCGSYGSECATAGDMTGANAPIQESSWTPSDYTNPIESQDVTNTPDCSDYLLRGTVAWSSIEHYNPLMGIPGWGNSILLPTLKHSAIIRYKLNGAGTGILNSPANGRAFDSIQYFRVGFGINRYRDIAIGANGITLYVITDSIGATSGVTAGGGVGGGAGGTLTDRGKLIAYTYQGAATLLNLNVVPPITRAQELEINTYPNPTTDYVIISSKDVGYKPYQVKFYDALGNLVKEEKLTNTTQTVRLGNLANGQYLVLVYNKFNQKISSKKIVVMH